MTIDASRESHLNGKAVESIPEPVSSRPPKSAPPPLPESASQIAPARAAADDAFADGMMERLAAGDYEGAFIAAEALLEYRPLDRDALDCAEIARSELRKFYTARLGSLDRVPHLAMATEALFSQQSLDFRAGLVLARIDGVSSLSDIVASAPLPALEALRLLSELKLRRIIDFDL